MMNGSQKKPSYRGIALSFIRFDHAKSRFVIRAKSTHESTCYRYLEELSSFVAFAKASATAFRYYFLYVISITSPIKADRQALRFTAFRRWYPPDVLSADDERRSTEDIYRDQRDGKLKSNCPHVIIRSP